MNYFDLTKGSFKEKRKDFKKLYAAKRIRNIASVYTILGVLFSMDFVVNTYWNNDFDFLGLVFVVLLFASNICFEIMYEVFFRDYVNGCEKEK